MWPFGKKDKNSKKTDSKAGAADNLDTLAKTDAQKKLLLQMRELRTEIGEENLQKMAEKLKLEDLKNKVRHDIDNNEAKKHRLLDEIRWSLQEDKDK
jgi:hypothetical protein